MPKLLEDAAKTLLREAGIAVPDGAAASTPGDAEAVARQVGAAVVVKALVGVGKRARAGGIRHAATPPSASCGPSTPAPSRRRSRPAASTATR